MTDSTAFGLFRYEECFEVEPGLMQFDDVQLLQDVDVHQAGTRFGWATVDLACGVLALRGKGVTCVYRVGLEIIEKITSRAYREMREEMGE